MFVDAGDGAFAGDRLRQGLQNRPLRDGQRSDTLKAAALKLGFVSEAEFNLFVDPAKMVKPNVANAAESTKTARVKERNQ